MKKKILVFGAAGFIGTYLLDELQKQGYAVAASDIHEPAQAYYAAKSIPFYNVDITKKADFTKFKNEKFDVVVHLAALQPANFNPERYKDEDYIHINVLGTLNILEFCRHHDVANVIYGTSHRNTAGLWRHNRPLKEEDGRSAINAGEYAMFSISESAAQDCVDYYQSEYKIRGLIFRLPPVYGLGPHLEIFKNGRPQKTGFQTFIENAEAGRPLEAWGDVNVGRDIIYIKDVVAAFSSALQNEKVSGLYNITSGYRLTLKEEIETIARVFWQGDGQPVVVNRPEKGHQMDSFVYDNSKAKRDFGWSPKFNFETMLHDMKKEMASRRYSVLVEKRKQMFE